MEIIIFLFGLCFFFVSFRLLNFLVDNFFDNLLLNDNLLLDLWLVISIIILLSTKLLFKMLLLGDKAIDFCLVFILELSQGFLVIQAL